MKSFVLTAAIVPSFILWGSGVGHTRAQTPIGGVTPTADFTYHLQRSPIAGSNPVQYLWMIKSPQNEAVRLDGRAFKSLTSPTLHKWITEWQHNGTVPITYIADERRIRKPDSTASKLLGQELSDFAQFCRSQGVPFVVRPAPK